MAVTWLTVFLDTPAAQADQVETFWADVTGWPLSSRRGPAGEFATWLPADGDAVLKAQVVGDPPPGMAHLDVHTDEVAALSERAGELGGLLLQRRHGYAVHRSPAGLTFCVVPHIATHRPGPVAWPGGASLLDQVCLDVPGEAFEREAGFWSALLGWPRQSGSMSPFERLLPPPGQGLHVLLQRLDDPDGPARVHLDLAADDVAAEVERHRALGAEVVRVERHWTTLTDPAGRAYCVTGRSPVSGRLP